jgi:hypothetical protein
MIEPDDLDTQRALQTTLAERIGTLVPPAGVYESVRRRHRRNRNALIGGTVVAVALAVGIPALTLGTRTGGVPAVAPSPRSGPSATPAGPSGPAATTPNGRPNGTLSAITGCAAGPAHPANPVPSLPAQHDVRGALGGDQALVTKVLDEGYGVIAADRVDFAKLPPLSPATATVHFVERVPNGIVALVSVGASGGDTRRWSAFVAGPDRDHLVGRWLAGDTPVPASMRAWVCGHWMGVLQAPAGTSGTVSWVTGVTPDGQPQYRTAAVPMAADGIAIFRLPAGPTRIQLSDGTVSGYSLGIVGMTTDTTLINRVFTRAPGRTPPRTKYDEFSALYQRLLHLPYSDPRVHWKGSAPDGSAVAIASMAVPGSARDVQIISSKERYGVPIPYQGMAGVAEMDRVVLGVRVPGGSMVVYSAHGVRAELVRGGSTQAVPLTGGGAVVANATRVTGIRVYDASGRLLGQQAPDSGLHPYPVFP